MDWLKKVIDDALDKMTKEEVLMKQPDPNMPEEMYDTSIPSDSDWKGWKPIPSVLNDSDIDKLETIIGIKLPLTYRCYLTYKHFYELEIPDFSANLHAHLPDKSLNSFKALYFEYFEPEYLIEKGFIYFADFQDYGLLCFDSNEKRVNNEYPIVCLDHDDLTTKHFYSNNFEDFMTADRERGNRFVIYLNEYYRQRRFNKN